MHLFVIESDDLCPTILTHVVSYNGTTQITFTIHFRITHVSTRTINVEQVNDDYCDRYNELDSNISLTRDFERKKMDMRINDKARNKNMFC